MTKVDLTAANVEEFVGRIEAIQADTSRKWGKMTPERLMRHLGYTFELSLGEQKAEKVFIPLPRFITWYLFFEWFTKWPEGKVKAPDSFCPDPEGDLEAERATCVAAMRRFVKALNQDPEQKAFTPLLGHITLRKWSRVHGVHLSHHLRQYGV